MVASVEPVPIMIIFFSNVYALNEMVIDEK